MIAELDRGRPVVLAMMITESFCASSNGVVPAANPGADIDYHAVLAVAHGHEEGEQLVLARNSGGTGWGLGGYGWLEMGYVVPRLIGIAMMGDERVT